MEALKFYDLEGVEILPVVTANKKHIVASFKLAELEKERENNKNSKLISDSFKLFSDKKKKKRSKRNIGHIN